MGGKASVLIILSFSVIFLFLGHNFNNVSTSSVDNTVGYYSKSMAHHIAVSGANIALNQVFLDNTWSTGYSNLSFQEGIINVTVKDTSSDVRIIRSEGTYNGNTETVVIKLQPSSYAKFAWYTGNMSSKLFLTGDTIWGPFHSQSKINIGGDPVFWGKVTTLKGLSHNENQMKSQGYNPKFYGGYESGVDIPLPNNYQFSDEKQTALDGVNIDGGSSYFENTDIWLIFNDNGTVTYRTGTGNDSTTYSPPSTVALTDFAPRGVIYVEKGDIYTTGTLNGKVTIVANQSSGSGGGNVYVAGDLKYRKPPMIFDSANNNYFPDNTCDDMMGILASNNLKIMNTPSNVNDRDVEIHASIFCASGGVELDDNTIPASGTFYLMGGVVAAKEEVLANVNNSGSITNGYKKHVVFDQRMMLTLPPKFPNTGKFEVVSWLE